MITMPRIKNNFAEDDIYLMCTNQASIYRYQNKQKFKKKLNWNIFILEKTNNKKQLIVPYPIPILRHILILNNGKMLFLNKF